MAQDHGPVAVAEGQAPFELKAIRGRKANELSISGKSNRHHGSPSLAGVIARSQAAAGVLGHDVWSWFGGIIHRTMKF
jgi:hypothetical protein